MRKKSAHEAENGPAFTCDLIEHTTLVFALAAEITLHIGTPLDVLVFVRERFAQPFPVSFFISW